VDRTLTRNQLAKTITVSAVLTFLATSFGQWGVGRLSDAALGHLGSPLHVEMTNLSSLNEGVMISTSPDQIEDVRVPNVGGAGLTWAMGRGGAAADEITAIVFVYADYPVRLDGMRAEVGSCSAPMTGTHIVIVGGGGVFNRQVDFDLDQAPHTGIAKPGDLGASEFPRWVSESEIEQFELNAITQQSDCSFTFVISYTDRGKPREWKLRNVGTNFRVTSSSNATHTRKWEAIGETGSYLVIA
jgi:hypothetical protein